MNDLCAWCNHNPVDASHSVCTRCAPEHYGLGEMHGVNCFDEDCVAGDDGLCAVHSTCSMVQGMLATLEAERERLSKLLVDLSWKCVPALRGAFAILRHKAISPPMMPGVQEKMEKECEAALGACHSAAAEMRAK